MQRPAFIARQSAHPKGCLGSIIGRIMANETAVDNERAIALLGISDGDRVLDVGTGHGSSLGKIVACAERVSATGIDASDAMLAIARRRNAQLLRKGSVRLEKASSDRLPFADGSFDKAMAIHTLYFWKPAEPHLKEIARVLRPQGLFCIGFRPAEDKQAIAQFPASVYEFRTTAAVEALMASTGFHVVNLQRRDDSGRSMVWLLAQRL